MFVLGDTGRRKMSWLTEHLFGVKNANGRNEEDIHEPIDEVASESDTGLPSLKEEASTVVQTNASTEEQPTHGLTVPSIDKQPANDTSYEKREVAAEWRVPLRGKLHKIEFEHGTTSGRRVLWIDEKVIRINVTSFDRLFSRSQ